MEEEMDDNHAENTIEDEPNYIPETGLNEEQQMYDDDNYKEADSKRKRPRLSFDVEEELDDSNTENTMEDEPTYVPETGLNEEQQLYDDNNYKEADSKRKRPRLSFDVEEELDDSNTENTMEDEPNYIPETGVNEEQQMYDDDNYKEALQEDT